MTQMSHDSMETWINNAIYASTTGGFRKAVLQNTTHTRNDNMLTLHITPVFSETEDIQIPMLGADWVHPPTRLVDQIALVIATEAKINWLLTWKIPITPENLTSYTPLIRKIENIVNDAWSMYGLLMVPSTESGSPTIDILEPILEDDTGRFRTLKSGIDLPDLLVSHNDLLQNARN